MKNKIIYLVLLSFTFATSFAQGGRESRGNKDYGQYAYIDAIKTYERLYQKGYKSPDMLLKLGNAYYFNADLEKAAKYYDELYASNPDQEAEYYFRYSQSLRAIKNYPKADAMMEKFNSKSGNDIRAKLFGKNRDYLAEIKKHSGRYKIENAGINSKSSDYGPAFFGTKVVFCSSRDTGNFSKRIHTWTGDYFTNLYSADLGQDGSLGAVDKFGNKLNSKYHEATPIFTKDGKTVYFTRNNYLKGKGRGFDAGKVTLLKIYRATVDEKGKWIDITSLPFNSDAYQVAHPTLSPDEKTLYFASDMPGTIGLSDIYKVALNADGTFGTPENLGTDVNTQGRETFPFISAKNELYFSSDGHTGLGGLDIFVTKISPEGKIVKVMNIGEEANSPQDDFGFIINTDTKRGFLSSNREGGQGNDDIYKFLEEREIYCEQLLKGTVTDAETNQILPGAKLTLMDEKFNKIGETIADKDGKYEFKNVECELKYYVRTELEGYNKKESPVIIGKETGETVLDIELEKTVKPVKVGDDIADVFGINLIYFDLDKWNIRPDAAIDLAKILDVLEQYPTMKLDIRSHTDSRQTHKYNEKLSDRRAKSTMDWLISKGITKDRLTAKGYGETQLVNKCADGVECTEQEHQLNRRSQFIITAL
jgi:outer membrane protein OmpA-like peptidoglycan-associated protein/Tol biopolymer transport system component